MVCTACKKWNLLAGKCSVCTSADRLWAIATSPRLPPTREAEAKVTKVLDGAFYSIARLIPEEEDSPEKGVAAPSRPEEKEKRKKGEDSPKASVGDKKEENSEVAEEKNKEEKKKKEAGSPRPEVRVREEKKTRDKPEEDEKKAVKLKEVQQSEEKKVLPRRKDEERTARERSRTPKHQREKEKRKTKKKDSNSRSVSGSVVRRKKREDHISHRSGRRRDPAAVLRGWTICGLDLVAVSPGLHSRSSAPKGAASYVWRRPRRSARKGLARSSTLLVSSKVDRKHQQRSHKESKAGAIREEAVQGSLVKGSNGSQDEKTGVGSCQGKTNEEACPGRS